MYIQFDGGSEDGQGSGEFIIIDGEGKEVIRMGTYYGPKRTKNKAQMFATMDSIAILAKLSKKMP